MIFLSFIAHKVFKEGAPAPIESKLPLPKQEEYRKSAIRVAGLLMKMMSTEQAKNYITRKCPNHPEFTSLVSKAIDDYANQVVSPPGWPSSDSPKPNSPTQPGLARKSEPPMFSGMK